jgi:formylglycine-generating enzyme
MNGADGELPHFLKVERETTEMKPNRFPSGELLTPKIRGKCPILIPFLLIVSASECSTTPDIQMIKVDSGTFSMGSSPEEKCREYINKSLKETLHKVTLTHSLLVGKYEVTQAEYEDFAGGVPGASEGFPCIDDRCPVFLVRWHDAARFCNYLSEGNNLEECYRCASDKCEVRSEYVGKISSCRGFRLPTEAEWEYIYRAGNSSSLYNGDITSCLGVDPRADSIAWYKGNSNFAHFVGEKEPNAWNIYDIAGNVSEWTNDGWKSDLGTISLTDPEVNIDSDIVVVRGGDTHTEPLALRAAQRDYTNRSSFSDGFRVVRTE